MTCSPFDLKDFLFGELNASEREAVDRHLLACAACHDEVAALDATRAAVMFLREEEPPRRIAFVSDKVFEPRWWQKMLASGPQLGFASAAMLAMAIVFHGLQVPTAAPVAKASGASQMSQVDQKLLEAEVAKRVNAAVAQVALETEARQTDRLLRMVNSRIAESDRRYDMNLRTIQHYLEVTQKQAAMGIRTARYESTGLIQ